MEFKVASFNNEILKNEVDFDSTNFQFQEIDKCFCIKIYKKSNTKTKGVQKTDGTLDAATDFIIKNDGKSLVELRFIFIDNKIRKIFYNSSTYDLQSILKNYFNETSENILFDIDIEKLYSISKIKLETNDLKQVDWINPEANTSGLESIYTDSQPDKVTINLEYQTPARLILFKGDTVQHIIKKYRKPGVFLKMRGFDAKGNILSVTDKVQLLIELDIFFENAHDLNNISLQLFKDKIRQKAHDL